MHPTPLTPQTPSPLIEKPPIAELYARARFPDNGRAERQQSQSAAAGATAGTARRVQGKDVDGSSAKTKINQHSATRSTDRQQSQTAAAYTTAGTARRVLGKDDDDSSVKAKINKLKQRLARNRGDL
jgi:hypothetical protein